MESFHTQKRQFRDGHVLTNITKLLGIFSASVNPCQSRVLKQILYAISDRTRLPGMDWDTIRLILCDVGY